MLILPTSQELQREAQQLAAVAVNTAPKALRAALSGDIQRYAYAVHKYEVQAALRQGQIAPIPRLPDISPTVLATVESALASPNPRAHLQASLQEASELMTVLGKASTAELLEIYLSIPLPVVIPDHIYIKPFLSATYGEHRVRLYGLPHDQFLVWTTYQGLDFGSQSLSNEIAVGSKPDMIVTAYTFLRLSGQTMKGRAPKGTAQPLHTLSNLPCLTDGKSWALAGAAIGGKVYAQDGERVCVDVFSNLPLYEDYLRTRQKELGEEFSIISAPQAED
jgi:hypothetical protein